MTILFDDVMQYSDASRTLVSPALLETTQFELNIPFEINFDKPRKINCIGIAINNAPVDARITFIFPLVPYSVEITYNGAGLYKLPREVTTSKVIITNRGLTRQGINYGLSFDNSLQNLFVNPSQVYVYINGNDDGKSAENPRPVRSSEQYWGSGIRGRQCVNVFMPYGYIRLDDDRQNPGGSNAPGTANNADPSTAFNYNQSFTIAFWVNVNSDFIGNELALFSNKFLGASYSKGSWLTGDNGNNGRRRKGLVFYLKDNNIRLNCSDGSEAINGANGIVIKDNVLNTWVHIAAVFDKSVGTGQVRYYADGVRLGAASINLTQGIGGDAASYIGNSAGTAKEMYTRINGSGANFNNYTMNFCLQDFVLQSGAMNDEEIIKLMNEDIVSTYLVGRIAMGNGVKVCTSIAKEPGIASTAEPRVTLSGQVMPGRGGYTYRTLSLDSRYKLGEETINELIAGYKYIGMGYPFFINLEDEAYKLWYDKLYAEEKDQRNMSFEGGLRKYIYSHRWSFTERF